MTSHDGTDPAGFSSARDASGRADDPAPAASGDGVETRAAAASGAGSSDTAASGAAPAASAGAQGADEPPAGFRQRRGALAVLVLGAIGIVFGDIGTSPLYTLRTVLTAHGSIAIDEVDVLGVVSMIAWCLIIIVTVTYVGIITRADNDGEGGILSLAALLRRKLGVQTKTATVAIVIAVVGSALFIGDSVITPAISVMSAVEGLEVVDPVFDAWVVPIAVVVLVVLFFVQRRGTGRIGQAFGPVMTAWFVIVAALGLPWVVSHPGILRALSPTYAIAFAVERPWVAFLALGATVLAVTGAEALYADLGHFGRRPIVIGWLFLAFPALLVNYLGQGAMLLADPTTIDSPFFHLAPDWARIPLVLMATCATVIASQAVISGAFSVFRQAIRLSLLPRLRVVQTSAEHGGQIYLPLVNGLLFGAVLLLVLLIGSSDGLASAYGFAVTGTLLLELTLFLLFARTVWRWPMLRIAAMAVFVGGLELLLFSSNVLKLASGGWIPMVIAGALVVVMLTWRRGSRIAFGRRSDMEGPIEGFIEDLHVGPLARVPGLAVYPHGDPSTTPLALRATAAFTHVLHEHVVIITVKNVGAPHVHRADRVEVRSLGRTDDGIVHVMYRVGFNDSQDVPEALRIATGKDPELEFDPETAMYVLSVFRIEPGRAEGAPRWPGWQRQLFRVLERFSANRTQVFHLPPERTIVMGAEIRL